MRYIQKNATPRFFKEWTKDLIRWNDCKENKKPLREYILKYEQNHLCIYCESKVRATNRSSHIEHIIPKHRDIEALTFNYHNISVSCNGNANNCDGDNKNYNCGHRKDKDDTPYDKEKFLNPLTTEDIRDYFEYDSNTYFIKPSNKDIDKAQYMIDTLHLNDGELPEARKKALNAFIKTMKRIENIKVRKEEIKQVLNKERNAFISFLRFKYMKKVTL